MLPFQRRDYILDKVKEKVTYISELAEELGVSEITIRRDLRALENENLIEIHHGGAIQFLINTTLETGMEIREKIYSDEKKKIGIYAASLVNDGDVIFIDSGSTTKSMIPFLKDKKNIVIVTNGFKNVEIAMENELKNTILLGGEFKSETYSFLGNITERDLELFYFDKSFIGVNGVDKKIGLTNANISESSLKRKAISRSNQTYTLVDRSKFGKIANYSFAAIEDTRIITDSVPLAYSEEKNINILDDSSKEKK